MTAVNNTETVTKSRPMEARMSRGRPSRGTQNHHKSPQAHDAPPTLNLVELKKKDITALIKIARDYNIENANSMRV